MFSLTLIQLQITLELLNYPYILDILDFRCVKAVFRFYVWSGSKARRQRKLEIKLE